MQLCDISTVYLFLCRLCLDAVMSVPFAHFSVEFILMQHLQRLARLQMVFCSDLESCDRKQVCSNENHHQKSTSLKDALTR